MMHGNATPVLNDAPDARSRLIARLSHDYLEADAEEKRQISEQIQQLIDGGPVPLNAV